MFKVTEGHLRSFGGNFVVLNSNLISAFNSASQIPIRSKSNRISAFDSVDPNSYLIKQSIQLRKSERVMFSRHCRSLEVIKRSFGAHLMTPNSILMSTIESASQKTYKKTYCMPQSEIW